MGQVSYAVRIAMFALMLGCGADSPPSVCGTAVALFGATRDAGDMEHDLVSSVAGVYVWDTATKNLLRTCTASRIAPHWFVTAKHCIPNAANLGITIAFQRADEAAPPLDPGCPGHVLGAANKEAAVEWIRHPKLDLALLRTEHAGWSWISSHARVVAAGERVVMAGIGLRETLRTGELAFLSATVQALDEAHIVVSAGAMAGACFGDSGGPLLLIDDTLGTSIVGVLSRGSESCTGSDAYVRLDVVRAWLRDQGVALERD